MGPIQTYDPYATNPVLPGGAPVYGPTTTGEPLWGGAPSFGTPAPGYPQPVYGQPAPFNSTPPAMFPGQAQPYSPPVYGQPVPATQGPTIFGPGNVFSAPPQGPYMRFFQVAGARYTWLGGNADNGREFDINDVELFATAAFPNFMHRAEPLLVTPGFIFHFWDVPGVPQGVAFNGPSKVYSAYLNLAWNPQLAPQFGAELNFRVGVYSDFDNVTSDSVRYQGLGLGVLQVTPTLAAKFGVMYLDRLDIKILPAGGVLWTPNPQTRFDIVFPRPKLAQYLTTVGNAEVWWYVGGEYGGGSWTIDEYGGRADVNDIRVTAGIEWTTQFYGKGFFEIGYVFDRELFFEVDPTLNFKPRDTIMLRTGLSF